MAENDSSQERTEQPTQKRLHQAREKGQVARSRELVSFSMMMLSGFFFLIFGSQTMQVLSAIFAQGLRIEREEALQATYMLARLQTISMDALTALLPFFALMVVVALVTPVALGGISFSWEAVHFKWEKLDPIKGLKKIVSTHGLMELAKALFKFGLVAAVCTWIFISNWRSLADLGMFPVQDGIARLGEQVVVDFLWLASVLLVIVVADVPFQLWTYMKNLRMTRQELRDEAKDSEGKPEVKAKIRSTQREISRRRMMEKIPKADVIITNPTHFACAIQYDQKQSRAPVLVAKGVDWLALQIRQVGNSHKIPVVEAPLLARSLFYSTELDREIPVGLYLAVAQVLAYVYQMQTSGKSGASLTLHDLPIPDDLKR